MNKLNKGKAIGIVSLSLAAVSLAGVGFSAWVISGTTGKDTGTVNVEVADIQDKRIAIKDATVTDNKIKFDADGTGTLLSNSNGNQDLNFKVQFTVEAQKEASFLGVKAYLKSGEGLKTAITNKYVTLPTNIYISKETMDSAKTPQYIAQAKDFTGEGEQATDTSTGVTTYTKEVSFEMAWGSAFNNTNPTAVTDDSKLNAYITQLKALKALDLSFTLELVPVSAE